MEKLDQPKDVNMEEEEEEEEINLDLSEIGIVKVCQFSTCQRWLMKWYIKNLKHHYCVIIEHIGFDQIFCL